jgi:hypothetical protein
MTSKHEYKNVSGFIDAKKGANPMWSHAQVLSSGVITCSDGLILASINTDLCNIVSPTTVLNGSSFLKAMVADPDCRVMSDSPNALTVGDEIFETAPTMRVNCFNIMKLELLARNNPTEEGTFGLLASHTATLGKIKDLKGKPDVVKLSFRDRILVFEALSSTLTGVVMTNTHPEISQGTLL